MKKILSVELEDIKSKLPSINQLLIGDDDNSYQMLFISIFDHWLSPNEFTPSIHTEDYEELRSRREKLEEFVIGLFEITPIYLWKYKRHNRIFIYRPTSLKQLLKKCNIRNQHGFSGKSYDLLLPEFNAVYSEEWDWTNIIWFKEKHKIKPLIELAKKAGLFILEK